MRWVAIALAVVACGGAPQDGADADRAPRFVARTLDATPVERSLDDYRGQPMLLNVWATWCDPCREEMPSMEALYQRFRDRGFRIVAVSIDDPDHVGLIREFVAEHKLTFDILHDPGSAIMQQYPVRGVPQSFLISADGRIVATRFVADWDSPPYVALVDSLLSRTQQVTPPPSGR